MRTGRFTYTCYPTYSPCTSEAFRSYFDCIVFAAARQLPNLDIYMIFCPMILTAWNALMRPLQSYASDCLLIMLLLHVQVTRISYRFSSKAEHGTDLSRDLHIRDLQMYFSRLYLYELHLPFLYRNCYLQTQSLQQKPPECCKRAAMKIGTLSKLGRRRR